MYYNNLKYDKRKKCNRVINLYCSSLDYHIILLKNENTTLEEFKLDIIGLISSLKKYSMQNRRKLDKRLYKYIYNYNLNLNLDKSNTITKIENFKNCINNI